MIRLAHSLLPVVCKHSYTLIEHTTHSWTLLHVTLLVLYGGIYRLYGSLPFGCAQVITLGGLWKNLIIGVPHVGGTFQNLAVFFYNRCTKSIQKLYWFSVCERIFTPILQKQCSLCSRSLIG